MISSQDERILNKKYALMLQSLLSHSVVEVPVPAAHAGRDSVTFLDTRAKQEYVVSHIENAIWVGYDNFKMKRIESIELDANIIVYCSVGYRSEKITEKLKNKGYTNVRNLYGGIFEWVNQGYPVHNELGTTNKVHPYDQSWGVWLDKGVKAYK